MGFWTCGPVLGSLIVAIVGSNTVPAVPSSTRFWTHEYLICGIAGLVVFVIALLFLRELSPRLRDQLMVTMQRPGADRGARQGHRHRGRAEEPVPPAAQGRRHHLGIRGVRHAADLLHGSRFPGHLHDDHFRILGQGREWPRELGMGLQRTGADRGRHHLRPPPGPQAVHGIRRRHGRHHPGDLPAPGRASPELLHARDLAGPAVDRPRHRLHAVDGELHRDRRAPQPGAHRDRPGHLGLDHPRRHLPGVHPAPGCDQLR